MKGKVAMEIDLIFKIAGTGIIVAVLNLVLKRAEREEQAMMTTLAGLVVVLMLLVDQIGTLFERVKSVFGHLHTFKIKACKYIIHHCPVLF